MIHQHLCQAKRDDVAVFVGFGSGASGVGVEILVMIHHVLNIVLNRTGQVFNDLVFITSQQPRLAVWNPRIGSVAVIQPAAQGAEAVAITDGRRVAVYIAGKQFLIGQDVAAEAFEGLTLRLDGWPGISGPSQVRFVDSADGADCGAVAVDGRDTGSLTLSLPPFTNDLVVIVD